MLKRVHMTLHGRWEVCMRYRIPVRYRIRMAGRALQRGPRTGRALYLLLTTLLTAVMIAGVSTPTVMAAPASPGLQTGDMRDCRVPVGHEQPETAAPGEVGIDQAKLDEAIEFAASRMRTNIQVYRHDCLIGRGPLNDVTDNQPWNLFSGTKSVVSMLAGVAYTQGKLDLNSPIGTYLPDNMGDAAHRAITVRDLLTQTSGLDQSIISEAGTAFLDADPNIVKQTLALPIQHEPGTFFEYTQHGPDLLAYVIQSAVGEDLQRFAQDSLFSPLGIEEGDYFWARDRSGHTYGYAFLYLPPVDFARLGLLMLNNGQWRDERIIAADYIDQARSPSDTNHCYGFLFWVNDSPCTGPSIPSRQTIDLAPLPGMPDDAYAMVGFLQQNNFIVPSLDLLVTWNGFLGDVSPDPTTVISASLNSELYHTFLRKLAAAFEVPDLPDPGPYEPTFNLDFEPDQVIDSDVLLGALGLGPDAPEDCNVIDCGPEPLRMPFENNPGCFLATCLGPAAPQRDGDPHI